MILSGFNFNGAPGGFDARRARPRPDFSGAAHLRAFSNQRAGMRGYGDDGTAALQQQVMQLRQRLAALGGVVNQLRIMCAANQGGPIYAPGPGVPASQAVVDVTGAQCTPSDAPEPPADAMDRAWYGDHLRGSDLSAFGADGGDFGDLDADLGLND